MIIQSIITPIHITPIALGPITRPISADCEGEIQSMTPEKLQYISNELHYLENLYVKCPGNVRENKF